MAVPIYDNHIHLRPDGEGITALRRFEKAGGTGLTLVNLPYPHIKVVDAEGFRSGYELTIRTAEKARQETSLVVNVAIGPYPVTFLHLREAIGAVKAYEEMTKAVDIASAMVKEGRAQAIGEVGRPHFPTDDEAVGYSNAILLHAMRSAAECSCPVIIHSESATVETMEGFAKMADSVGLDRGMVVKHLAPPLTLWEENFGVIPSLPASRSAIRQALGKGGDFLIETDFIDDPQRPGAAMDVISVPKRVKGLMQSGELSEEMANKCGRDLPARLYGKA